MKVERDLTQFSGDALIIGCGHQHKHHFGFFAPEVVSASLHPAHQFYHVGLTTDYSEEGKHDVEGDFLSAEVIKYLSQRKFDLICFEAVTEIFSENNASKAALEQTQKLLSEKGICFIYFGGRDDNQNLKQAIEQFNFSCSFTYGANKTWSLIGSNTVFDLFDTIARYPYLQYIAKNVIGKSDNLEIVLNFKSEENQQILQSNNPEYMQYIENYHPMMANSIRVLKIKQEEFASEMAKNPAKKAGYGSFNR